MSIISLRPPKGQGTDLPLHPPSTRRRLTERRTSLETMSLTIPLRPAPPSPIGAATRGLP